MRPPLISEEASLIFSDFFKLNIETRDVLAHFGYSFQAQFYPLPKANLKEQQFSDLKARLERVFSYLSLTSEAARREFLIAPVLSEVAFHIPIQLRVEYPLKVNEQLKGTLDYYLEGKGNLLVIEAKQGDPERGFTQLAVELVALDKWLEDQPSLLYGAISLGDIWRFGILDRQAKQITQDINCHRVPTDLDELMAILIAILNGS